MTEFSDFLENAIIDHYLRNSASGYTPAATVYVALFTAVTGLESNSPSAEVSGGSYQRTAVTFSAASGGTSSNSGDVTFPEATASWGTITHMCICDHQTNVTWGTNVNVLMWTQLTASKDVGSGDTLKFPTGDIDVTID